jgi:hypothetical protein
MLLYLSKKIIKKIINIVSKDTNQIVKKKDNQEKIINKGDLIKFNNYAKEKQKRKDRLYGKCKNPGCKCDIMFKENFIGLVTNVDHNLIDTVWPSNFKLTVSKYDVDKISKE